MLEVRALLTESKYMLCTASQVLEVLGYWGTWRIETAAEGLSSNVLWARATRACAEVLGWRGGIAIP